jgi:hypothetical protein
MSDRAPEETAPEVPEVGPTETAWEQTAARDSEPATVAQPVSGQEFEASLDAAIDRHEQYDQARDGEEEPAPEEPERRDYSGVVDLALEMKIPLRIAEPREFADVDLQDEGAIRERLNSLRADEENAQALSQAYTQARDQQYAKEATNELALEDARMILEEGDPARSWQAASIIQEQHPDLFDQFMREFTAQDPQTASVWSSQHPPIDWEERVADTEDYLTDLQEEAEERAQEEEQRAISESYVKRIEELEADPTARRYVDPALHLIAMQLESGIDPGARSPEQARAFIDASVKTARELARTHAASNSTRPRRSRS